MWQRALVPAAILAASLNTVEETFAGVKGLSRRTEARAREALSKAAGAALDTVTAYDARGFSSGTMDTVLRFDCYDGRCRGGLLDFGPNPLSFRRSNPASVPLADAGVGVLGST